MSTKFGILAILLCTATATAQIATPSGPVRVYQTVNWVRTNTVSTPLQNLNNTNTNGSNYATTYVFVQYFRADALAVGDAPTAPIMGTILAGNSSRGETYTYTGGAPGGTATSSASGGGLAAYNFTGDPVGWAISFASYSDTVCSGGAVGRALSSHNYLVGNDGPLTFGTNCNGSASGLESFSWNSFASAQSYLDLRNVGDYLYVGTRAAISATVFLN